MTAAQRPTIYVSERAEEAVHAEGEVTERMVWIVGISEPADLMDALLPPGRVRAVEIAFGFLRWPLDA